MDEYVNHKLRDLWQRKIEDEQSDRIKFRTQLWCGRSMLRLPGMQHGVAVLGNEDGQSTIWGLQHCKNPWTCPVCSATKMAKAAADIACAIDACEKWYNEVPFMVTLSIQHIIAFTCEQAYQILFKTWSRFYHHGNKSASGKYDPFRDFCVDTQCTKRIRATEFTYGKNGWHPHFHCLFFVPKKNLQKVLSWQEKLSDRWSKCMAYAMKAVLKKDKRFPKDFVDKNLKRTPYPEFYISTDDKGKVRQMKSSMYICGWGADQELTKLEFKHAREGHYTPIQILEKADEVDKQGVPIKRNIWLTRYYQLACATKGKYRIRMSHNMKKIIQKWKQTNDYIEVYKKKVSELVTNTPLKLLVWFTEEQWFDILSLQKITNKRIVIQILKLARAPNATENITNYLLSLGIDIRNNHEFYKREFLESIINHLDQAC